MTAASEAARAARDPRLDVFRGIGMFIILIAHIPNNAWAGWIPARFGFSDAAEIFVFCSGVASGIAFGRTFERAGLALGSARIAQRVWQIYWAHLAVFVAVVAALALADRFLPEAQYLREQLNLGPFLDDPASRMLEFLTLTYVPNYFDILPMYLGILAMVPLVILASRIGGRWAVFALITAVWLVAAMGFVELPAESWGTGRPWFFNPFSWQLLFFLGFSFSRGWLPPVPVLGWLIALSIATIVVSAMLTCRADWACHPPLATLPGFTAFQAAITPLGDKTHLGLFRLLHFAALAYLAVVAAGVGGRRLARLPGVGTITLVGRQTLSVFLAGLWLAQVFGVALDVFGRTALTVTLVNVGGCGVLIGVAAITAWFKRAPWIVRSAPAAGQGAAQRAAAPLQPASA